MRDGYEDYARFLCHVKIKSAEHDSRCEIVTGRYFSENLKKKGLETTDVPDFFFRSVILHRLQEILKQII